jgi:hypothetical protein
MIDDDDDDDDDGDECGTVVAMTVEEIEVIGEVLPQYHFVHHKPYMM